MWAPHVAGRNLNLRCLRGISSDSVPISASLLFSASPLLCYAAMLCSCSQLFFSETWEIGVSQHPSHRQHRHRVALVDHGRYVQSSSFLSASRFGPTKSNTKARSLQTMQTRKAQQGESRYKKKVTKKVSSQPKIATKLQAGCLFLRMFPRFVQCLFHLVPSLSMFFHFVPSVTCKFCCILHETTKPLLSTVQCRQKIHYDCRSGRYLDKGILKIYQGLVGAKS